MAIDRAAIRVSEGGHNIPNDVIKRRYFRGIENLFNIYIPLAHDWAVFENSNKNPEIIAQGMFNEIQIMKRELWDTLLKFINYEK